MSVKAAFRSDELMIPCSQIVPLKDANDQLRQSAKYKQIAASLEHVGLVESLVVFPVAEGKYLLLDGNTRFDILNMRCVAEVRCLIATDDESYTYNKRANYLSPIAEHHMLLRALNAGVSEERIAKALRIDVTAIRRKRDLLAGICDEAVEILRDKQIGANSLSVLRKMKPARQIQAASFMVAAGKFTYGFAHALLLGTPDELLTESRRSLHHRTPPDGTQKAMLERETETLLRNFKAVEESYGADTLILSVSCAHLRHLLDNTHIQKYLTKHHPEMLQQIKQLISDVRSNPRALSKAPVKAHAADHCDTSPGPHRKAQRASAAE